MEEKDEGERLLTIKELTVKNFMSVGNQAQAIDFSNKSLVLVIGENMDLGGDDAGAGRGLPRAHGAQGLQALASQLRKA